MLIFILLLSEGQAGEVWKPFNKSVLFNMSGNNGHRRTSTPVLLLSYFRTVYKWNFSKIRNVEVLDEISHILLQQKNNTPMNNVLFPMSNDSFNSYQNFFFFSDNSREGFAYHNSGTSDLVPRLPVGPILELSIRYITYSLLP